jgi:hypothetical protein
MAGIPSVLDLEGMIIKIMRQQRHEIFRNVSKM